MEEILKQLIGGITMPQIITWLSFIAIFILGMFFIRFIQSTHDNQDVDWLDLITDKNTKHVSLSKTIQLVGATISSWVVIKLTLQEKLTWDLFSLYLMYCAGTEGYSKYLSSKYGFTSKDKSDKNTEK